MNIRTDSARSASGICHMLSITGVACFLLVFAGCGGCTVRENTSGGAAGGAKTVVIDGSSTVFPITQAAAEEFQNEFSDVNVVVGESGTGGGFKKFIQGETDINDASRPIKQSEIDACKAAGVEYIELTIAIDGLSVIVNSENNWCNCLTVAQLKKVWEPGSQITKWSELDPAWPDEEIQLYGPDIDSGTFDYFTEVICGEEGASRTNYTPSADDNVLVRGIQGDKTSLGYFGYAYYFKNKSSLKIVGVSATDSPSDCVIPTNETVMSGEYTPLSRPLFLYVNKASLKKPAVASFVKYCLGEGQALVDEVGYVRLGESAIEQAHQTLDAAMAE